jgi:hypothetical protein
MQVDPTTEMNVAPAVRDFEIRKGEKIPIAPALESPIQPWRPPSRRRSSSRRWWMKSGATPDLIPYAHGSGTPPFPLLLDPSADSPVGFLGGFGRWRRCFRRRSCGRSFPGSSRSAPRSSTTTPGTATTPATSASGSSWSASRPTRLLTATRHPHPHHLPVSPFFGNKFYGNVILPIFLCCRWTMWRMLSLYSRRWSRQE